MALTKPGSFDISGTNANDTTAILSGTDGNDVISGGLAATSIDSNALDGIDTMEGGGGDDTYIVHDTGDIIIEVAGGGTDTVWSSATYTLATEVENIGASGKLATTLTGNAKDNILDGSQNASVNTLVGGTGNDTYFLGAGDKVTEATSAGIDKVFAGFDINLTATANFGTVASAAAIDNVSLTATGNDITGNALNNILVGNTLANSIVGGLGNDTLDTGAGGADTLNGGDGNDTYWVRAGATASITDSTGVDLVKSYVNADVSAVGANIENVTLMGATAINAVGNTLANILTGNDVANTLTGNDGNDTLVGNGGNDALNGGAGNDTLNGGTATTFNTLSGGAGSDIYIVTDADDVISGELATVGETDSVQFIGTTGTFTMGLNVENITLQTALGTAITSAVGNASNNIMTGNAAANTLTGGLGNDNLTGNDGNDTLNGDDGIDILTGGNGDDTLNGGAGNDTLNGGAASVLNDALLHNVFSGGAGNDTYIVINATDTITGELATVGEIDTVQFGGTAGTFVMGANVENITLTGTAAISATGNASANIMNGNALANTLSGGDGNDTINGLAGDDALNGGIGNDILTGGTGNDIMLGGVGDDTYSVDALLDVVDETTGSGVDTVNSSVTYALNTTAAAGIEKLNLTGTAANGTGNALANTINGNTAVNVLSGLEGNDTINAGAGNDTIIGGAGKDTVIAGAGNDIIQFAVGVTDTVATATSIAGVDLYSDLVLSTGTADKIQLTVAIANVATSIAVGADVSEGSFITDMNAILSLAGQGFAQTALGIDAAIVTADAGSLSGKSFLAVDLDASGTFTATDFVIEITGSSFDFISTASFL